MLLDLEYREADSKGALVGPGMLGRISMAEGVDVDVAVPVAGAEVTQLITDIRATHLVTVPDTNLRTVLAAMPLPVVRAATEDDVLAICAGLWMAGRRPVALMQQLGIFASVNALRAFVHDQQVPLVIIAGVYGRDCSRPVGDERQASAVRLLRPLLTAMRVDSVLIETPADIAPAAKFLDGAYEALRTAVVLVGAPTS